MENLPEKIFATNPILLTFICLIPLVLLYFSARKSGTNSPPCPPRLPIIGNLHQLTTRPNHALANLALKYGPLILLHIGPTPVYVISSAELAREVTVTQESKFPARPKSWAADVLFCGGTDLIFSSYGHYWRQVRKLCVNELLSVKRVQCFQYIRDEEVEKLVSKIRLSCLENNQHVVNLGNMLLKLANDIVCRAVLGQKYTGEGDASEIMGRLAREASELTGAFSFRDYVPSLSWLDNVTGFAGRVAKTSGALDAFLNRVIEEHYANSINADESDDRKDFVDIIFQLQKEKRIDLNLTLDNIKAILLDMFVAGTDTSASTMEWMMAELVRKPSTMKKVQEEVRRVVGDKSRIDEHDITRMEYFRCAIKETLRLYSASTLARVSSSQVNIGGFQLPAKATVLINSWAIQRDPEVWDMPLEFLPERFKDSALGYRGQDIEYFPFGLGRRICPGAQFALTEVEFTMANLLCWFDWEMPDGVRAETLDMSDTFAQIPSKKIPLQLVPILVLPTNG